jgi:hypothetical protein
VFESNEESKQLLKAIDSSESYLKTRFRTHCQYDDTCSSHCIKHSLSNPKDNDLISKCNEKHDSVCGECLNVIDCIATMKLKAGKLLLLREKELAVYEVVNAEMKIMNWMKHIIRGVQQSKAREDSFTSLQSTTAIWIRDFAQKYNPTKVCII